jgi:hypothetical protein
MKIKKKLFVLIVISILITPSLQGCGALVRALARSASRINSVNTHNPNAKVVNGYDCFPVEKASELVDNEICLYGKITHVTEWDFPLNIQYSINDFTLIGGKYTLPDIEIGDCVAALGYIREMKLPDAKVEYYMNLDMPDFQSFKIDDCN